MKRSSSRNKPRFSFRDVDPYSKTKTVNIKKVQRGTDYAWDKENDGNAANKRPRSLSNENIAVKNSPSMKNRKGSFDYQ